MWLIHTLKNIYKNVKENGLDYLKRLWKDPKTYAIDKPTAAFIHFMKALAEEDIMRKAADLTYSTILSIVPILAIGFSLVRGFGKEKEMFEQIKIIVGGDGQLSDAILASVKRSVELTTGNSDMFFAVAVVLLMCTSNSAFYKLEKTINEIWDVKTGKGWFSRLPQNMFFLFLVPVIVSFWGGITGGLQQILLEYHQITDWGLRFLVTFVFLLLIYKFVPETSVKWRSSILAAIGASVFLVVWHAVFVYARDLLFNYNKLYGSFAVIPFFIMWANVSWIICLVGAKFSVVVQNFVLSNDWNGRYIESVESLENESLRKKFYILLEVTCFCVQNTENDEEITITNLVKKTNFPIHYIMFAVNKLRSMDLLVFCPKDPKSVNYQLNNKYVKDFSNITISKFVKLLLDANFSKKDKEEVGDIFRESGEFFESLYSSKDPKLIDIAKNIKPKRRRGIVFFNKRKVKDDKSAGKSANINSITS